MLLPAEPKRSSSCASVGSFAFVLQVVESCREGMCKPDPRIYQLCLERLGVQAQESVFLDDIGQNLKAAAQLGIKTLKVRVRPAASKMATPSSP